MLTRKVLALLLIFQQGTAMAAEDPALSTSVGRFAAEALEQPVREQVDLCSATYPELQSAMSVASAELLKRHASMLAEALETDRFSALSKAEVPLDLFLLYRGQSAMRREVNTRTSKEKCERTLGEFTGISDQFLRSMVHQFLELTESSLRSNASAPNR